MPELYGSLLAYYYLFGSASVDAYIVTGTQAFYLPWAVLALDVIFGSTLVPDLMGIIAGHLYYFQGRA